MAFEHVAHGARRLRSTWCITVYAERIGGYIDDGAVSRRYAPHFSESHSLGGYDRQIAVHGCGFGAGYQGAIRFVRPVDKGFRYELEPMPLGGGLQLGIRHADEGWCAVRFSHDPGNNIGKFRVRYGVVVERTMRFHVGQPGAQLCRNISKARNLIGQSLIQCGAGEVATDATETVAIRVCRMGADANTVDQCSAHGRGHRVCVTRMAAASDIAARYDLQ